MFLFLFFLIVAIIFVILAAAYIWKAKIYKPNRYSSFYYFDVPKLSLEEKTVLREYAIKELLKEKNKITLSKSGYANYNVSKKIIPGYVEYIESNEFAEQIRNASGKQLSLNPFNDKEKLFLKVYYDENDGMGWHYDKNFSNSSRYTVVIPLIEDECNTSHLNYIDPITREVKVAGIQEGKGILYEGDKIYHSVTRQTKGCLRISLITVLYDSNEQGFFDKTLMHIASMAKNIVNF